MVVFYNVARYVKTVMSLGTKTCKNCGYTGELSLVKDKLCVKLFFVLPIFSCTTKKAIFCPRCGTPVPLTGKQFNAIKNGEQSV